MNNNGHGTAADLTILQAAGESTQQSTESTCAVICTSFTESGKCCTVASVSMISMTSNRCFVMSVIGNQLGTIQTPLS